MLVVSVVDEASGAKPVFGGESKRCLRRFRTRSANRTVSQARKLGQSERPLLPSTSLKHGASRKVSAEKIFFEKFLKERNGGKKTENKRRLIKNEPKKKKETREASVENGVSNASEKG